jgi:patatin-like phospholipase/acyl hydrolase
MAASVTIPFTTTAPGNFVLAHNLNALPQSVVFQFTDGGTVWFQPSLYDYFNLYLVASDTGVTGNVTVYASSFGSCC